MLETARTDAGERDGICIERYATVSANGLLWLLLLQASAPPDAPAPPDRPASDDAADELNAFDLSQLPELPSEVTDNVIVVRADPDRYRVGGLDLRFETNDKAEIDLGNGTRAAAEVEAETIAPGIVSKRMMLRLKMPF